MDNELVELLKKVASKKLTILQFVEQLKAIQKRLGPGFDFEFQASLNVILEEMGKSPTNEAQIVALKKVFSDKSGIRIE